MVFAGLHLDRFQGVFIQNPVYFIGLIFLFPFLKKNWMAGGTILLTYASFVVPNALHPAWYGGFSFAGRFGWSGAVAALPFVIYGVIKVAKSSKAGLYLVLAIISLNIFTYSLLTFQRFDLYNKAIPGLCLSLYTSFHPLLSNFIDFLPALFDQYSAYGYSINGIFLIFFIGLTLSGLFYKAEKTKDFFRSVKLFCLISFAYLLITGFTAAAKNQSPLNLYNGKAMHWNASDLPSAVGVLEQTSRIAKIDHGQGFLTYGPYISLKTGTYKFEMKLNAASDVIEIVGYIDVFMPESGKQLNKIAIWPNGTESITGTFSVPKQASAKVVEIRTFYQGVGEISIQSLELARLKQYP
jgi:hypothetical protein